MHSITAVKLQYKSHTFDVVMYAERVYVPAGRKYLSNDCTKYALPAELSALLICKQPFPRCPFSVSYFISYAPLGLSAYCQYPLNPFANCGFTTFKKAFAPANSVSRFSIGLSSGGASFYVEKI